MRRLGSCKASRARRFSARMNRTVFVPATFFLALSAAACSALPDRTRAADDTPAPTSKKLAEMIAETSELLSEPKELTLFRIAYPDVDFSASFDEEKNDWKITIAVPKRQEPGTFWWASGRFLPEEELRNADRYWPVIYSYASVLEDPEGFDEERIRRVKEYSSSESRKNGAGTPPFFFDFLYSADSQREIESHIVQATFLNRRTRIHERIRKPLRRVEEKIVALARNDGRVADFVASIQSSDAYHWRIIDGTTRKSFHSYGIAVDVLPRSLGGKAIFWSWEKDRNPDGWMVLPLSRRWMPPDEVVRIFEEEGFIWGGKWGIWDNMHFEYHPELILNTFGLNALARQQDEPLP